MFTYERELRRKAGLVKKTGFALMDPEKLREIARRGGAAVPAEKRSFYKDRDLATDAGRKGGIWTAMNRKDGKGAFRK